MLIEVRKEVTKSR